MNIFHHPGIQVREGMAVEIDDAIAVESRFRLILNNQFFSEMIASDDQLHELGAGFVVCEGLSDEIDSIEVRGTDIMITAKMHGAMDKELRSSGCIGVRNPPGKVRSSLSLEKDDIYRITREIETDLWRKTGGVHCSVLFHEGELVAKSSDVGRHNTVDKVIGHAILHGIDRSSCIVGCTGRQPAGMVGKCAHAGIPVIVSRAASTDQGIAAAEEAGITLICFSRGPRFTVYTHPERIRNLYTGSGDA
ncbi:MAG: formate dehydrogenase accessory sulfurtransferase FdhD [Methanoregulaceae archaeon]|nr:formate dehydrogenase accessory sulfurtransferase FdhD [Methanoregulaceae archaeon]